MPGRALTFTLVVGAHVLSMVATIEALSRVRFLAHGSLSPFGLFPLWTAILRTPAFAVVVWFRLFVATTPRRPSSWVVLGGTGAGLCAGVLAFALARLAVTLQPSPAGSVAFVLVPGVVAALLLEGAFAAAERLHPGRGERGNEAWAAQGHRVSGAWDLYFWVMLALALCSTALDLASAPSARVAGELLLTSPLLVAIRARARERTLGRPFVWALALVAHVAWSLPEVWRSIAGADPLDLLGVAMVVGFLLPGYAAWLLQASGRTHAGVPDGSAEL